MDRPDPAPGRVHILDADRVLSSGGPNYPGIAWTYAGAHYCTYRSLLRKQGADREVPFREVLYATTYALKGDYIEFIGTLNCQNTDPDWQLSSVAERNCFISHAFATICTLAAARTLLAGRKDPELLIIFDTPGIAAHMRRVLDAAHPSGMRVGSRLRLILRHLPRAVANRIAFVALGIYRRLTASVLLGKPDPSAPYAILSFVYDRSFRGGYEDVVFGPLLPWLEKRGLSPVIIPLVIPPTPYGTAIRQMRDAKRPFMVPEAYEPVGKRTLIALSSLFNPPPRIPRTLFHDIPVEEILEEDRIHDWAGRRVMESRILGESLGRIRAQGTFRVIAYPFENHIWEKAVCSSVRSVFPETFLIGFQHSTIYSTLLNYFIASCESGSPFLPHRIVTSGSRAHELLIHSGYPKGMVRSGGAIRFVREEGAANPPKKQEGPFTILVAPTVDRNESVELISRVVDACADLAGVRIVIRCHPDLPFDRIAPLLEHPLPANALAGGGHTIPLHEAGVLVFSSTSVAMEALAAGVPVIQITTMDPLTGNRFEGIPPSGMLQYARTDAELRQMVDTMRTADITTEDRARAQDIVRMFFGPVDEEVFSLFLPGKA